MASQYGQDEAVLDILNRLRNGFFLDSGASDGVRFSNTLLLERSFGWRGICVEPNGRFFQALTNQRTSHCLNCCIYDREGEVEFLEEASVLGGILAEYDPALLKQAKSSFNTAFDSAGQPSTVMKRARRIVSILEECKAPAVIDYWSLDTEGSELAILKSFPFDTYSFRVLTVEHNWLPVRAQLRAFLESKGYRFFRALGCDDCYVTAQDYPEAVVSTSAGAWRSRAWNR